MLAVGLSIAGLAIADDDDAPRRRELISKIDDAVEDAGDELSGFESDSDDGDLRDALSYINTVESLVRELDGKKGSDSSANAIVSRYPRYISDFRQAAQYLGKLKQGQRSADNAADRCKSNEADLQTMIRYYVGRPDEAEDAFNKLPDKAREFQRTS